MQNVTTLLFHVVPLLKRKAVQSVMNCLQTLMKVTKLKVSLRILLTTVRSLTLAV